MMPLANMMDVWSGHLLPFMAGVLERVLPESLNYRFMHYALLEVMVLAPMCAAIGVKVVNFRMAFFSDAISHSAFAGIAIGLLLAEMVTGFDPRIALITFALLVGLGIAAVRRRTDLSSDTATGVVFSAVVALGIGIVTARDARTAEFQRYLFGDIISADAADIGLTSLLALLVIGFLSVGFNSLMLVGMNAELAHSRGVWVRFYDYVFSLLLALVVAVSIKAAGILLVTAMLIVPAAAARNLAMSIRGMVLWALVIGLASGVVGTLVSFTWLENVATSACIVLTAVAWFGLSLILRRHAMGRA